MATSLQDITSVVQFEQLLVEKPIVVVHFWASWSEPCKQMDVVLSVLSKDHPDVAFVRVEAEALDDITLRYDVNMVPFFIIFKNGTKVDHVEGADAASLTSKVTQVSAKTVPKHNGSAPSVPPPANIQAPANKEDVIARIKKLLASSPVLLFMKGSPVAPRCGFSRKVVEALNKNDVVFDTFDILQDEELRQALKEFSNWPTYPQLYVKGELLGGCDIILEMEASGELGSSIKAQLPQKEPVTVRIKRLLDSQPIMLFMKGSPDAPKCGFSRKVAEALSSDGLQFGHFDILQDEELRQGLKEYANWPTYPQLYVRGELLGGCDIILEMKQAGELKSTVDEMLTRMDVAA